MVFSGAHSELLVPKRQPVFHVGVVHPAEATGRRPPSKDGLHVVARQIGDEAPARKKTRIPPMRPEDRPEGPGRAPPRRQRAGWQASLQLHQLSASPSRGTPSPAIASVRGSPPLLLNSEWESSAWLECEEGHQAEPRETRLRMTTPGPQARRRQTARLLSCIDSDSSCE